MTINLMAPDIRELKPRITVMGCGGAGGNAVNNMIECGLQGVEFVVANTDAQALGHSRADRIIQMGLQVTEGLGAGSQPEVGRAAAEEVIDEIRDQLSGAHMVFITAGMGGGTGTGAAPVVARVAREMGILTVGVVTKPFQFEGHRRMRIAEAGIAELQKSVDTLIVIPNQNLFRVANEKTTFAEAFAMADQVLYSGVASITDLMVKPGLINLDFADVRAVMREMGKAMMGTGEATGEKRAIQAAEAAIANPLLDEVSMKGAKGLLISITGGRDMMLYELDEAATRIREEVDPDANIILGATQDDSLEGIIRVSVVATGIDRMLVDPPLVQGEQQRIIEAAQRLRSQAALRQPEPVIPVMPKPIQLQAMAEAAAPAPVPVQPAAVAPQPQPVQAQPAQVYQPAPVQQEPVMPAPQPAPVMEAAPASAPLSAPVHAALSEAGMLDSEAMQQMVRQTRMPRVEELPLPAQQQLRATPETLPAHSAEAKRMTLLQRLAAVGLGRRDDGTEGQTAAAPAPAPASVHQEYMRRQPAPQAGQPAQGRLDAHGRSANPRSIEDDQLEIPAFLRRAAN
jgi:cell division protein FtsZ